LTQVFLNYRADDDPFGVVFLDEKLSNRFGDAAVFLASKSIPLGARWEKAMFQAVADSAAVLAVIGRGWLTAKGRRHLDDRRDFVRREILTALELGKRVIPVRLGVPRLSARVLPPALAELARCQDIEIRFRSSKIDVDRLATELAKLIPELPEPPAAGPSTPASAPTPPGPSAITNGVNIGTNNVVITAGDSTGDIVGRDQTNHAPRRRRS
jgi:hypothetical protein